MTTMQQPEKPFGYIYKITNLVTGLLYIGQTKNPIERRWTEHKRDGKMIKKAGRPRSYLHNAMSLYGSDSFTIELLDVGSTRQALNEKEEYWISTLNTLAPGGYNIRPGGWDSTFSEETLTLLSNASKARWNDPEFRTKTTVAIKLAQKNPETVEKHRRNTTALWEDPKFRQKQVDMEATRLAKMQEHYVRNKELTGKCFSLAACTAISLAKTGKPSNHSLETRIENGKRFAKMNRERHANRWFVVFDTFGRMIGYYNDYKTCAKDLNVSTDTVAEGLKQRYMSKYYRFAFVDPNTGIISDDMVNLPDKIQIFEKTGTLVGEYVNISDCAKSVGVSTSAVHSWLRGTRTPDKYIVNVVNQNTSHELA